MDNTAIIQGVVEDVVELLSPQTVYLYNEKHNPKGEILSFKLCIIASLADKEEAERLVYRGVECEVPFDILLYTPEEWSHLIDNDASFASRVNEIGRVVYG